MVILEKPKCWFCESFRIDIKCVHGDGFGCDGFGCVDYVEDVLMKCGVGCLW